MARGRKRLSTAEQIEKTEAMVLQKKQELDELVAELKRLREIEKKENQAALLAAVAKSKWSFEQIMEFVQSDPADRDGDSGKTAHPSRRDGMLFRFKRHDAG